MKICNRRVLYSSLAQSVERMTVNHDVVGSSPTGGANKRTGTASQYLFFFLFFQALTNVQRDSLSAMNVNRDVVSTFALGGGRLFKPRKELFLLFTNLTSATSSKYRPLR